MPSEERSDHGPSYNICEKLAEAMHGSLSITSTSQGTQGIMNFRIRVQQEKLSGEEIKPKYVDQETALILLRGMRILLGDSDGFNKAITKKVLERTGCELTTVSSWHQCVEALYLKGNWFHILLIDLLILQEDQDVTVRIRKLRSESWLLVIALVPNADRDTKERCLQNGIHGVIRTPVILQEMIDEIQRVTQQLQVAPALI